MAAVTAKLCSLFYPLNLCWLCNIWFYISKIDSHNFAMQSWLCSAKVIFCVEFCDAIPVTDNTDVKHYFIYLSIDRDTWLWITCAMLLHSGAQMEVELLIPWLQDWCSFWCATSHHPTFLNNTGLSWTVSAPDMVTAVPVRRNANFQTPISVPAVRPKRCHTLSNPAHRQDYMVACLNYTLQMMQLPGWLVMAPNAYDNNNNPTWITRFYLCRRHDGAVLMSTSISMILVSSTKHRSLRLQQWNSYSSSSLPRLSKVLHS